MRGSPLWGQAHSPGREHIPIQQAPFRAPTPPAAAHLPPEVWDHHAQGSKTPKPPTLKQVPGSSSHCRLGGDAAAVPGLRPPVLCSASTSLGLLSPPAVGASPRGHRAPWGDTRQSDTPIPWLPQEPWSRDTGKGASAQGGSARDPPCITLAGSTPRVGSPALRLEGGTRRGGYPQDMGRGPP